jgi:hypothetical protein
VVTAALLLGQDFSVPPNCVSSNLSPNKQKGPIIMSVQFSRQGMAAVPLTAPVPRSPFVRRLLRARNNPVKARVLAWLLETDDARLLGFGLTPEDIALLRGITRQA